MSWHYLQGQEVVSSEGICWDGDAFVPSKSKTTLEKYCLLGKEMESCHDSRSGMTLRRSMDTNGEAVLMWFQGDSPVRTYLPPEKEKGSVVEKDLDYGPSLPGSLARYNPALYSWKIAQCSLFGGLTLFSATWPRWGMMQDGELFLQKMPALRIREKGSGSWPTPNKVVVLAPNGKDQKEHWLDRIKRFKQGKSKFCPGMKLEVAVGGQPNPTWEEWLMGWPMMWTSVKQPLETDKFQAAWLRPFSCWLEDMKNE